jgi:hypothetical protein
MSSVPQQNYSFFTTKDYAEDLPQLIKDTLPDVPLAHRVILLKGLRDYGKGQRSKPYRHL